MGKAVDIIKPIVRKCTVEERLANTIRTFNILKPKGMPYARDMKDSLKLEYETLKNRKIQHEKRTRHALGLPEEERTGMYDLNDLADVRNKIDAKIIEVKSVLESL